ncbi:ABC transporter substrate-binding protein [Alicyclobacillus sp. SO9]|uniref:ABC transporter substrate-binding protein n=1 Tax=Alicyclobacillus sp. SO9 TaxID=2665646 RepID=UPI0018E73E21|nr:ABC transporter substrate-binding protein [Alicyclobacillus sp. SO9]QQE78415.1 ABC transporter substrate-binding protein [Alicyclobacillus sp. SO9]
MKKLVTACVVLGLGTMVTACSPANSSQSNSSPNNTSSSSSSVNGNNALNILWIGSSGAPGGPVGSKFPGLWLNRGGLQNVLMFRSLFLPNAALTKETPDLAKSYSVSSNGLTYKITMKNHLKWQDGKPLTAKDVVWSIKTVLKATLVNPMYTNSFSEIKGAKSWISGTSNSLSGVSANGNVITINLVKPVADFIDVLGQFPIYPEHLLKNVNPLQIGTSSFWKHPIGDGMYKLSKFVPGNYAILVPSNTYNGPKPKIKKIIIRGASNPVLAAQKGNLDLYNTNNPQEVSGLKSVKGFVEHPINILYYRYLIFNIKGDKGNKNDDPMANYKVRQAILYGINRRKLAKSIYPSLARINNTGVPSSNAAYDSSAPTYSYNPTKAKQLLKQAHFNFGQTIKLRYYYSDQNSKNFMTAVAQYLRNLGMKVNLQQFQGNATDDLFKVRNYDIALKGLSAFNFQNWYNEYSPNPNNFFTKIWGKSNLVKFNADIKKLSEIRNPAQRKSTLLALQKLEEKTLYKAPLFMLGNSYFVNNNKVKLAGKLGNPWYNYNMDFQNWTIK